ncbi:MAG: KEOPS complex subunit Pcc1 [Candidatus Bathyarchaeota archaeon]|nr:KEOPS complex subunit Pcc1 [Candidatus Bathyarchaeota archaeon]
MKTKATVRLQLASEKQLATLLNALAPETAVPATKRSRAVIEKEDKFLILNVEAEDTVALRAMLNAYLRWISSALNVMEVIENTG